MDASVKVKFSDFSSNWSSGIFKRCSIDDVLKSNRIEEGVNILMDAGDDYGVTFSDAQYIDEHGNPMRLHSEQFPHNSIPCGDVYTELIQRYFICSPTMMFRKLVLDSLKGYDEALAFEDFDFWIRSSRNFKFIYSSSVLVGKRVLSTSMSATQFHRSNPQRWSTLEVCKKIKGLNRTKEEVGALKRRLHYEVGVSLKSLDFKLAFSFWKLQCSL